MVSKGFPNVTTSGRQYNFGEKPSVILYTYINLHAGTPKPQSFLSKSPGLQCSIGSERELYKYINHCCCCSHSAHWLPTREKLFYTVTNPARGLLNRKKKEKKKVWQRPPLPPARQNVVDATRLGAWLRSGEGIGWLAAGTMPNSLYRVPFVYLFLACCVSVCFLPIHSGHQWTYQPGSHRISHPPFCGTCFNFSREKDSANPFPRRP